MKLTIGADPEVWIFDNKLGKIISAHGLFPGSKEEPFKVEHGAIQVDGMAAEYNIFPASNSTEFVFYNLSVLRSLRDKIAELNPDLDFKFVFEPVTEFGAEYIAEQPEEARRLGCTPDFDAWRSGATNPTPDADMPFRTTSGHIHFGWTNDQDIDDPEFIEACCMLSKQLDYSIGGNNVLMEDKLKLNGAKRRELYGKAGAFRPKHYGCEYRTPSNVWLSNTVWMDQMFSNGKMAFNDLLGGFRYYEEIMVGHDFAKSLNESDTKTLKNICGGAYSSYSNNNVTMENLDFLYDEWKYKFDRLLNLPQGNNHFDEVDDFEVEDDDDDDDWGGEPDDNGFIDEVPMPDANPALELQPWAAAGNIRLIDVAIEPGIVFKHEPIDIEEFV